MQPVPLLEDCLKLLKGERDEQRLAGLLLATKFCKGDDTAWIVRVYDAVGVRFLDRLLMTGMGKVGDKGEDDREAYLQLSVTILAAFCLVQEIAASKDMVSKVPVMMEILSNSSGTSISEECYEFLLLVATSSEDGLTKLYESGVMNVLAAHVSTLPDGSRSVELSMRLLQLMLSKSPLDIISIEYASELSCMVVTIARQFAMLHNALKFDALHLLADLLSSKYAAALHDALRSISSDIWATYIRVGIMAVLQNRVASAEKFQALVLAESVMCILGESWLLGQMSLPGDRDCLPADRCLLLVLESSRVEVAVLLNEVAYLKYEASNSSSSTAETIRSKQRNLAISFSLIEKIIKLISNACGAKESPVSESTSMTMIAGLNETVGLVLDFLQDAKDHGQKKGDDLLASVRIIGRYLAETPLACKEKVQELLEYIFSIEGEDEPSPFYSICFLLPMLCQTTMETEGCRTLASFGGHKAVADCLVKLIEMNRQIIGDDGTIFLACDTVMNFLLKNEEIRAHLDAYNFVHLLRALAEWTEDNNDTSIILMAASICTLIFDLTSEEALRNHPTFDSWTLNSLSRLIHRSLDLCGQGATSEDAKEEIDLHQIVTAGYGRWADRFPLIRQTGKD